MKKSQIFFKILALFFAAIFISFLSIYFYKKVEVKKAKKYKKKEFTVRHPVKEKESSFQTFQKKKKSKDLSLQAKLYSAKYPVKEEKPIVVLITSYNNEKVCEKNLSSIFSQNYQNYRVIYVDDCSSDKTYDTVMKCIKEKGQTDRCTLIRNPQKSIKMANVYKACTSCKDEEIIITVDGDDWLIHENVFSIVNQYYHNPDVWMTHGSAIIHPGYRDICGRAYEEDVIQNNKVREVPFQMSMLRTFYAGLFKQIKIKDLMYNGDFIPTADDVAFMTPMAEMAGSHAVYVPEILYVINDSNPIREMRISPRLQELLPYHLKQREKYKPLVNSFNPKKVTKESAYAPDLFILATHPDTVKQALSTIQKNIQYYGLITVLSKEDELCYQELMKANPSIRFVFQDFQPLYENIERVKEDFVVFCSDKLLLKKPIDIELAVSEIRKTKSSGYFFAPSNVSIESAELSEKSQAISIASLLKLKGMIEEIDCMILPKGDFSRLLKQHDRFDKMLSTYFEEVLDEEDISLFSQQKTSEKVALK
ncbi:MAG: glycosyltransferase family 2 protein [Chlamydiae bacterium]|nr:glycosyltransferase family 2 protein [Chlamydiota bacterium]